MPFSQFGLSGVNIHNNNFSKESRLAWPDKKNTSKKTTALQISIQQLDRCVTKTSLKQIY